MKIAYADPSRSAYSSHYPTGKASSHAFAALHHSSSSTLLCNWLGWMAHARHFQHLHSWHGRQTHAGTLQLSLPALRTPCTKQARRQDLLLNQAQSPSALSRILIPASVTSTVHVAELGLHLCTVKHVQAVRAWGQYFALSLSCQSWHKAVAEVPFSALKSYGVLKKCLQTSAAPSARGKDHSITLVTIMSRSVSIWACHKSLESSFGLSLHESGTLGREMAKVRTAALNLYGRLKAGSFSYLKWEY